MFLDICGLVGHRTPVAYGDSEVFTFEKRVPGGFADAYLEDHFVWEFKGRDRQLSEAVVQAVGYARHLKNPPLIVASSFETIRIETNFQGMELVQHNITLPELAQSAKLDLLRNVFHNPDALRPQRSVSAVTQDTAQLFSQIVADMEGQAIFEKSGDPELLARYLNRIIFCLYAEDAGLLPEGILSDILYSNRQRPDLSNRALANLFGQMAEGGLFGAHEIAHFNGDLFRGDTPVELSGGAMQRLGEAVVANWRSIEPSIFGTLFERALDASKRAQTGAHYTGAADIDLVVEPVVMTPLRREWDATRAEIEGMLDGEGFSSEAGFAGLGGFSGLRESLPSNGPNLENLSNPENPASDDPRQRLESFRRRLASVTVLDPACGSGNFLYIALRSLLDLEREVIDFAAARGWTGLTPTVQPNQMLGLEVNHYAAELARTALWIGYIQWHQANGFPYTERPILTPLDTIRQTDAILDRSDPEHPAEPEWPTAEFIIGNPPFLGSQLLRANLNDEYVDGLFDVYEGRVPGAADLACYWFDKAQSVIAAGKTKRAGLLATQGIRGGASRRVLQRIKETGDIFMARSDLPWVLEGAAVHISIVGFDDGSETDRELDGYPVASINANLTAGVDLTQASRLSENLNMAFQGPVKVGPFDIAGALAQEMLSSPNPHNVGNSAVISPWVNGRDITDRTRGMWIIDFRDMALEEAALYEAPFEYVNEHVRPVREQNRDRRRRENWWRLGATGYDMRRALAPLSRFIVTPRVSKHRLFVWVAAGTLPDSAVVAIAHDDNYTFGVLHSRFHELWARGMGTQLREVESGFRYAPTTCFETFPFPHPTSEQRDAIANAAAELNRLREGWLNPEGIGASELRRRTLTNLYNQRPTWLGNAHRALDAAVADAYGWPADLTEGEILERLLALNLERAGVDKLHRK